MSLSRRTPFSPQTRPAVTAGASSKDAATTERHTWHSSTLCGSPHTEHGPSLSPADPFPSDALGELEEASDALGEREGASDALGELDELGEPEEAPGGRSPPAPPPRL